MTELLKTESLCPVCMRLIPAVYVEEDGKVYLEKECLEHGKYKVLVWSDAAQYELWSEQAVHSTWMRESLPFDKGCPYDCGVCEKHKCGICTAVLEITYRCNMECKICFANAGGQVFQPDLQKIREMYETAKLYGGDCSIQLSGGEPTVREDLPEIIKLGKEMGFSHIQINTNGIRIARDIEYLRMLKSAGADLIYLQFDGMTDEVYERIRGRKMWEVKRKAVENCEKVGIGVMLVPVIIKDVNIDQTGAIIQYAKEHMPTVKGVHFQPVSYFGRYQDAVLPDMSRTNLSDVIAALEDQTGGEIKTSHIVPRKPYDAHCSFSGLYYLDESGMLQAISSNNLASDADEKTDFAKKTNKFTNEHWRMRKSQRQNQNDEMEKFINRLTEYSFSLSGMGFQDIWNFDTKRLQGCCVFVITWDNKAVPLCAFHVTSLSGERLYQNTNETCKRKEKK